MIMYAAVMGNAITAVFQCPSAIFIKGFFTLFLLRVVSQCLPYIGYSRSLNEIACIDKAVEARKEPCPDHTVKTLFPMGNFNEAYAKYFVGQSYLNMLLTWKMKRRIRQRKILEYRNPF